MWLAKMERLAIRVIPKRYPEHDESATPGTLAWDVNVHIGPDKYTRTISDPFSEKDHAECRWYLEHHVPVDPFDQGRSDRAASALRRYAKSLAQQLNLTVINCNPIDFDIYEDLSNAQDTRFSIFRLHWELLEDAHAWGLESLNLRIRRHLPPRISLGSLSVHKRPLGPIPPPHVSRTINILHVVARSRGATISEPTDISPYLALRVLTQLSEHLRKHRCPLRLKITTIRPGTFEALAEHVVQLANGGKGESYHLVHLDVHGQADQDGAKLFFESSKATEGHNSTDVSNALMKLGVEFIVLNACRSARADLGHDANTASIFTQSGCGDNVLAMAFETLSGAAEIFLRSFYTEFLMHGASFGAAAQRGRMALRSDNVRKGRLNQTLPLADWFSPVTYTSVSDLAVAAPVYTVSTNITWERGLVGRDYDVAELEKILLKRRKAFLYGHAWIGKTAFLQYAHRIWAETSFADEIMHVDLASSSVKDVPSLVQALRPRRPTTSEGNAEVDVDSILQHVKSRSKVLVIIDGVDAISTASPVGLGKHKMERKDALQIGDFLKLLYESCKAGQTGSMILFAGRLAPSRLEAGAGHAGPLARTNAWLFTAFKSSRSTMELQGLSLVDSLEICEETARQAGQPVPQMTELGTRNNLELLMRLLLGIPGAISPFILAAHRNGVLWLSLRTHLLSGHSRTYRSLLSSPETASVFEELKCLALSLSPEEYSAMLLIGLFWHQGPYDVRFAEAMVDFGVCADRKTVDNALNLASERGYIRFVPVEGVKRINFVHPVFTIYCRAILEDLCRQILSRGEGTQPVADQNGSLSDENAHLCIAAKLYAAVEYRKRKIPGGSIDFQFVQWFIENVDYQLMFQLALPDEATNARTPFKVQQDPNAFHFLNGLTCFGLCTDRDRNLAPEDWPLDYFVRFPSMVMSAGTAAEAALFSEQLENLLCRHLELKGADLGGVEIHRSCFILSAVSLVMLRKWHANDPGARWKELAAAANSLCESSVEKSGLERWASLVFQLPGIAVSNTRSTDFAADFEKILDGMPKTGGKQNDRLAASMARGLARSAEEARAARVHITGYPLAGHDDNTSKQIARDTLLELVRRGLSDQTGSSDEAGMAEIFNKVMTMLASQVGDRPRAGALMFMPRSQSSVIEKHRGNGSSIRTLGEIFDSPSGRLDRIEAAMNSGDWATFLSSNTSLLVQHLQNGDSRQAFKYLETVLPALRQNPAAASLVETMEREMKLQELSDIALGISAADTDTPHDRTAAMAAVDEMERILNQSPAISETQREVERNRIASLRAAAEQAAGHSAEDFARIREDFKAMNLRLTGEDAEPEAILKRMQISNQASQLMKEIGEAINGERDLREGFAKMDQLEELCRQQPIAMFVIAGEEGIAKWRGMLKEKEMMIQGMKLEMQGREMHRQAIRTLAEVGVPLTIAALGWLYTWVKGKIWGG